MRLAPDQRLVVSTSLHDDFLRRVERVLYEPVLLFPNEPAVPQNGFWLLPLCVPFLRHPRFWLFPDGNTELAVYGSGKHKRITRIRYNPSNYIVAIFRDPRCVRTNIIAAASNAPGKRRSKRNNEYRIVPAEAAHIQSDRAPVSSWLVC